MHTRTQRDKQLPADELSSLNCAPRMFTFAPCATLSAWHLLVRLAVAVPSLLLLVAILRLGFQPSGVGTGGRPVPPGLVHGGPKADDTFTLRLLTNPEGPAPAPAEALHLHNTRAAEPHLYPSFMVVGGLKTGSTFLHVVLSSSPYLRGSQPKEIYAFADAPKKGLHLEQLQVVREPGDARIAFSSPAGELRSGSAALMRAVFPDMRLIVLLREPIERAHSFFQMRAREKLTTPESTFEELVALEAAAISELLRGTLSPRQLRAFQRGDTRAFRGCLHRRLGVAPHCRLLKPEQSAVVQLMLTHPTTSALLDSIYVEQMLVLMAHFPADQLLIIKSEDLFSDPLPQLRRIEAFVGAQQAQYDPAVLATPVLVWPDAGHITPGYAPLDDELRCSLARFFAPWNARLHVLLNVSWPMDQRCLAGNTSRVRAW